MEDEWERACTLGSMDPWGFQSLSKPRYKGAPEGCGGGGPKNSGQMGFRQSFTPLRAPGASVSTAEKTHGREQIQRDRLPTAGNRQGGEVAQVLLQKGRSEKQELQREVGGASQGRPCSGRGLLFSLPASLPREGPDSHLLTPLHVHLGPHMLPPSPFQRALAAKPGRRVAMSLDSLPERQRDARASLSPSTCPSHLWP